MSDLSQAFDTIIENRRSIRKFSKEIPFDGKAVERSIKRATLAPNSSNMQLWEFHRIVSKDIKTKMTEYCLGQNAARSSNELVVVVTRKDLWKQRAAANIKNIGIIDKNNMDRVEKMKYLYYSKIMPSIYTEFLGILGCFKSAMFWTFGLFKPTYREVTKSDINAVVHKSAALAAQNFMMSMSAEGYDTCPMEGFDSRRVKKLLNLSRGAKVNMVIACGTRVKEGVYGDRWRVPFEEVYKVH